MKIFPVWLDPGLNAIIAAFFTALIFGICRVMGGVPQPAWVWSLWWFASGWAGAAISDFLAYRRKRKYWQMILEFVMASGEVSSLAIADHTRQSIAKTHLTLDRMVRLQILEQRYETGGPERSGYDRRLVRIHPSMKGTVQDLEESIRRGAEK
jgi:hypothetical protein